MMKVGEERFNGDDIQRPVIRSAAARGNRDEICNRFRLERVVADDTTCSDRDHNTDNAAT